MLPQKKRQRYETPPEPVSNLPVSPPRKSPLPLITPQPRSSSEGCFLEIDWDNESVHLPSNRTQNGPKEPLENFKANIKALFYEIDIFNVYKTSFNPTFKAAYESCDLKLHTIAKDGDREVVDIAIEDHMNVWAVTAAPYSHFMIIANDEDYIRPMERLRRAGFFISLVTSSPAGVSEDFKKDYQALDWHPLLDAPTATPHQLKVPDERLRIFKDTGKQPLPVKVLWDLLTCPIPDNVKPEDIKDNVDKFLQQLGHDGVYSIEAYTSSPNNLTSEIKQALQTSGIVLTELRGPKKKCIEFDRDFVDVRLKKCLCVWAITREPPSPILIVSDDGRMDDTVNELRKKTKFEILVAHSSDDLAKADTSSFLWGDIASGSYIGEESDGEESDGEDEKKTKQNFYRRRKKNFRRVWGTYFNKFYNKKNKNRNRNRNKNRKKKN